MGKTNTFSQIKRKTPKLKSTFNALFHWGNRAKREKKEMKTIWIISEGFNYYLHLCICMGKFFSFLSAHPSPMITFRWRLKGVCLFLFTIEFLNFHSFLLILFLLYFRAFFPPIGKKWFDFLLFLCLFIYFRWGLNNILRYLFTQTIPFTPTTLWHTSHTLTTTHRPFYIFIAIHHSVFKTRI